MTEESEFDIILKKFHELGEALDKIEKEYDSIKNEYSRYYDELRRLCPHNNKSYYHVNKNKWICDVCDFVGYN